MALAKCLLECIMKSVILPAGEYMHSLKAVPLTFLTLSETL